MEFVCNKNNNQTIHSHSHSDQPVWAESNDRDTSLSPPSSSQSESEDGNEIARQGFHRFRVNNANIEAHCQRKPARTKSIAEYCTESYYSYSFTPLSRVNKASRMKREILNRGMDYMQRVRCKIGEQDTGRRFSQPDIGVLDRNQSTLKTSPSMSDLTKHGMQPEVGGLSRSSTLTRHTSRDLPPIDESPLNDNLPLSCKTQYTRALHAPSRFLPQNQAILTTNIDGIILLFNDMASLCFGMDKTYIGQPLLPVIENPFQTQIHDILQQRRSLATNSLSGKGVVLVCGAVMPIRKISGETSAASLWLKEKMTDDDNVIYIWIFEEIYETSLSVSLDDEGRVVDIEGKVADLFGYEGDEVVGSSVDMLLPALIPRLHKPRVEYCGGKSKNGDYFPLLVTVSKNALLKIVSLPSIAGLITVHTSGRIQSISPVPAKYLFGYSADVLVTFDIEQIIPQFKQIVEGLKKFNLLTHTMIVNNNACRWVLSDMAHSNTDAENYIRSLQQSHSFSTVGQTVPVIYAVHRDGSQFEIQLQLRMLEEGDLISVWVTYDRIQAFKRAFKRKKLMHPDIKIKTNVPVDPSLPISPVSPIPSHNASPMRYGITSYGSVDRRSSIFPSHFYQKNQEDPPPQKEETIDNYVILGTLGEGAYGTAKLAYHKDDPTQTKFVIKYVPKSKIIVDSWIRDRKQGLVPLEIHILKKLQEYPHRNCCSLETYMEDDDCYYIVMQLCGENSVDLFDYIELNEHINESDIRNIFRQIAEAVDHLQSLNIVHRDIKDENILLDENGCAHLIDFGSAAYFKPGRMFDTFGGTLDYCAPEILKGMPYEGPPQDIWSLGTLLYTLICRENPFYNVDEIMEHDLRVPFVLSEDSLDLIKHMLDRNVEKRYTIKQVLAHPWLNKITV